MSDAAPAAVAPAKTKTPRKKAAAKPKKPAEHPKYIAMVRAAIKALKDHKGASRQAILKYVMANYKVGTDAKKVGSRVNVALRNGLKSGALKHSKTTTVGASGRFRLGEKKEEKKPKAKKPKAKKPKAAKPKAAKTTPKKAKAAKKKTPKKAKAAKPKAAKKSPKKVKAAKPKAAKPKKAKTPKKKAAAKKAAK